MHVLVALATVVLLKVAVGGRSSVVVLAAEFLQDISTLGIESIAKVAAHALRLRRSDVTAGATVGLVAVDGLVALAVHLRGRANEALTVATSVLEVAVAERRGEGLGRRRDGALLRDHRTPGS